MVKKGKLSKVEKFYIENNVNVKTVEEIAEELDRSVSSVSKVFDTHKAAETESKVFPNEGDTEGKAGKLMGTVRHKSNKKTSIGKVMTESASSLIDSRRDTSSGNLKDSPNIHNPLGKGHE